MARSDVVFKLDDIELAVDFVKSGDDLYAAYLDLHTGRVVLISEYEVYDEEEEEHGDFDDTTRYVVPPDKHTLGLGSSLAKRFVREVAPSLIDEVYSAFSKRGGFRRFKDLLDDHDLLDSWHAYEIKYTQDAIMKWCAENDIRCAVNERTRDQSSGE